MSMLTRGRTAALTATVAALLASGAGVAGAKEYAAPCPTEGTSYRYVVLFDQGTPQRSVARDIAKKCGTAEHYYSEIGVAVASSIDPSFEFRYGLDRAYSAKKARDVVPARRAAATRKLNESVVTQLLAPEAGQGDLSAQSWDMRAIRADEANKVNPGSRRVVVGVLDSGIDAGHPDLVGALDKKLSAGCDTGRPDTAESAWAPTSAHGTHVAGTIAAARDGKGITGVAPGVRLAAVRVIDNEGMIYPESAVCGFMWAAAKGFAVTNNSWFSDPWMFWCKDQPGEKVGHEAIRRALRYSARHDVVNVAAAGNFALDLANPTYDPAKEHPVNAQCQVLPGQLDDVVNVSAVGYQGALSSFSDYGRNEIDVAAPGGDFFQTPPEEQGPACPLSTVPGGQYGSMCGTSMASPHVAGVVALLASRYPYFPASVLRWQLAGQADAKACPTGDERCTGGKSNNSFFGRGVVNALKAVR